jgi:hypothetical protein
MRDEKGIKQDVFKALNNYIIIYFTLFVTKHVFCSKLNFHNLVFSLKKFNLTHNYWIE